MTRAAQAVKITTTVMFLLVGDKRLPLREAVSKVKEGGGGGNVYHGLLSKKTDGTRYLSPYGVCVPKLSDDLPDTVRLLVQQVEVTGDDVTVLDEKTVPVKLEFGYTDKGNRRAKFSGAYDIPFLGRKMLTISISSPKNGDPTNNVIAKAINLGAGGAGGGSRIVDLDDL